MIQSRRPKLCPCRRSCRPVSNSLGVVYPDAEDLTDGRSCICLGKLREVADQVIGPVRHVNDLRLCLICHHGVVSFEVNDDDLRHLGQIAAEGLSRAAR